MRKIAGLLVFSSWFMVSNVAFAQNPGPAGKDQLVALITRIINLSVEFAFIALLIVLVIAGFRYLTSGGDAKAISSANSAVTWALLGIVFMAVGWIVLRLIENFTGVPVTKFCLGFGGCT